LWTHDVVLALDRFILFVRETATMTTSQKQLRLKQQQRQQRVNAVTYAKKSGARHAPLLLPPPIPQALLDIIVRCLAPDRNQRFQVIVSGGVDGGVAAAAALAAADWG
jgi:hypothetical protein